jgi:FkbM family methyltransferase
MSASIVSSVFGGKKKESADVSSLISLIFGAVTPEQNHILHRVAHDALEHGRDPFRALIMNTDQQDLPSRIVARFGPDDIEWCEVDGLHLATDASEGSVSPQVASGYEPHVSRTLRSILRSGDTFVDVGANIGVHVADAARIVGERGRVIAVEPNSENCRLLLLTVDRNGLRNVTLVPAALSDDGEWTWFSTHIGSNGGVLTSDVEALTRGFGAVVPVRRLDDVAPERTRLIKIDVEGAEIPVLRSGLETIRRDRPSIIMEFSCEMVRRVSGIDPLDALSWIEGLGYGIAVIRKDDGQLLATTAEQLIETWKSPLNIEDLLLSPR